MGFYPTDKIVLSVTVDFDGMFGKLARIKKLNEELAYEISALGDMINTDEVVWREEQTVFDLLASVTDTGKFAEIIYDLLQKCGSPEEIKNFLDQRRDNLGEAIDYLKSRGYPIEHKAN